MKKVIFLSVLLAGSIGAEAQSGKAAKAAFDSKPFDTTLEALPVGYRGHDCSAIATVLKKQKTDKDEMETTDEYKARMENMSSIKIGPNLTVGDTIALRAEIEPERGVKYMADARMLYIMSQPQPSMMYVNEKGPGSNWVSLARTEGRERRYQASNAYGATVTVTSRNFKTCAVAFTNLGHAAHESIDVYLSDVGADVARRAKAGVSFFYVGKLERPFIKAVYESSLPKIDFPFESHWTGDAVVIRLEQAWAVEAKTGEVLGKREFSH
ncbi:hypothetical protein [Acidovorax sp. CCYZU-2555]|uniref:hypothetical protein n=1 Tax=Acidovorax sp. CCYZU-2555 TaxID=2835042 RepID=UPI001BD187D8|nr:hypothetical protein [Acidovorax sp. CCYZU-2555]MBS7777672.1 hypothetical protein [Acidovorax sp. CCYZU-2555]